MSSFNLEMLTEGIRARHVGSQNKQLVEKWNRTGLLRGLDGTKRENMARMLENQAGQVLKEASSVSTQLTTRQRDILSLLQQGLDNQKIASQLSLSIKTVENHLTRIYRLLGVQSRLEAVNYILQHPQVFPFFTSQ